MASAYVTLFESLARPHKACDACILLRVNDLSGDCRGIEGELPGH
jgi:hypothetical protein